MAKRFKLYEATLARLRDLGTGTATQPGSNTPAGKYKAYKAGEVAITYTREEASKPGEILKVGLNPFGLTLNAANLIKVSFSARANTASNLNTIKTACNHSVPDAASNPARGFIPAKAVVFLKGADPTGADPTSQITGVKYKKKGGNSYTFPYGQATGKTVESEVRSDIATAVDALVAGSSVSFNSEEL